MQLDNDLTSRATVLSSAGGTSGQPPESGVRPRIIRCHVLGRVRRNQCQNPALDPYDEHPACARHLAAYHAQYLRLTGGKLALPGTLTLSLTPNGARP